MMKRSNIAVAVSGSGRTLENLLVRQKSGDCAYRISCVIASRPDCRGVDIAKEANLPVFCHKFPAGKDASLEKDLAGFLNQNKAEWIVLAGFLRPLPILEAWRDRIVNIHPALLPSFGGKGMYGMHVHNAVIAAGATETGATVHFVNEHYDEGAIIAQIKVTVVPGESAEALATRVFAAETTLYPDVINRLVSGKLPLDSGTIYTLKAD